MEHGDHAHALEILFHPYLVHFPIAFFFLEAFLILLWYWKKDDRYEDFAYLTLKLAVFSMPFVMLAGYIDAGGIPTRIRLHFIAAVSLFCLGITRLILRWKKGRDIWKSSAQMVAILFLLLSVVLTGLTGHLGGLMVYG